MEDQGRSERKKEMRVMTEKWKGKEWGDGYIKIENIHFNPSGKLAFKSNSFSCNLVQNCNLVRKLIPN